MKNGDKDIIKIGQSIRTQIGYEDMNRRQLRSVGRLGVDIADPSGHHLTHVWLTNGDSSKIRESKTEANSEYVCKNSPLGVLLTKNDFGTFTLRVKKPYQKNKYIETPVKFFSKTLYTRYPAVSDIMIDREGEKAVRFNSLESLLRQYEALEKEKERKKKALEEAEKEKARKEAEIRAKEDALARAKEEEAKRIQVELARAEEERRKHEEELRLEKEAILELEERQREALEKMQEAKRSFIKGREMRVQSIVDQSQTAAKVSHIYDGVPIVIEGGPGTGKTTTSIQRLKFLTDEYLSEHEECSLSEDQVQKVTNPATVKNNWLFISPSEFLSQYLKSALAAEGLSQDTANVIPYDKFLITNLAKYGITKSMTDKRDPFRPIKPDNELYNTVLISNGEEAVNRFEWFALSRIKRSFERAKEISTSGFLWQKTAVEIQLYCRDIEKIQNIRDLPRILTSLRENTSGQIQKYNEQLKDLVNRLAFRLKTTIMSDSKMVGDITELFEIEKDESVETDNDYINNSEEEDNQILFEDIEQQIYQELKALIRKLSIQKYPNTAKLSQWQELLYDIVKGLIDKENLTEIGSLVWFNRNFASLTRGVEPIMIRPILNLYKSFRREQLKKEDTPYNTALLAEILKKNEGRLLHRDEQSLLLGFVNHTLHDIYQWSTTVFNNLRSGFAEAYKSSVRYVIGIDEASDYSELDYYCLASFAHYEFSAITLCGDIMQGLGCNGIDSWDRLKKWIFPKLEVITLKTSYRQWPELLEMSRQMYMDDQGQEAPYHTTFEVQSNEPKPLAFVSNDENAKAEWIGERISEVYKSFGELPSIAIFVNENEDVETFKERLNDVADLDAFFIKYCTDGDSGRDDTIRIFHLSEVKGMEFEAVFFHNIDKSSIQNEKLLNRYLYVGISRARSYLGATFSDKNSQALKYFKTNGTWEL